MSRLVSALLRFVHMHHPRSALKTITEHLRIILRQLGPLPSKGRPVAFRPLLTKGLALSGDKRHLIEILN
jgi:hypothetical protein